jgi:pilus assembly protein CpaC
MNLNYSRVCLLSFLISLTFFPDAAAVTAETAAVVVKTVVLNKSALVDLENPARFIMIADKDIIFVPDPLKRKELLISGKKIGSTDLVVWEENIDKPTFFEINVVGDANMIEAKIRQYTPHDAIKVQYAEDTVILSGKVENELTKRKAEEIAKAYATKVLNQITIDAPLQVLLQVKVAQVDKSSLKRLGTSTVVKGTQAEGFSNSVGAPNTATTTTTTGGTTTTSSASMTPGISGNGPGLGSFNPLDAFQLGVSYFPGGIGAVLQALSSKGVAKVLAEPNLLVKSGQEGNFFAGSKIPYSVLVSQAGAANIQINWEKVGIRIVFKPEVLENGLIHLKIDPAEVSSIAGTLAANGYPTIDTRDVRTSVELRSGESLVLAGLLQDEEVKTMSKIPILGDIPILGALFRTTQNDITQKELVFVITPKIMHPTPEGVATLLPTERELTLQEGKELEWMPSWK